MSDILCLYYSRSGNTRQTMAEIAKALEAELVEFTDCLLYTSPSPRDS